MPGCCGDGNGPHARRGKGIYVRLRVLIVSMGCSIVCPCECARVWETKCHSWDVNSRGLLHSKRSSRNSKYSHHNQLNERWHQSNLGFHFRARVCVSHSLPANSHSCHFSTLIKSLKVVAQVFKTRRGHPQTERHCCTHPARPRWGITALIFFCGRFYQQQ